MSERTPKTESELIERIRSIDVQAPPELQRRIEALVVSKHKQPQRGSSLRVGAGGWRRGGAIAALTAVAVAAVALGLSLTGGGSSTLSVQSASALALRPATMGAPAEDPSAREELAAKVDGVAFPYWEEHFGWRSTGSRMDHLDGRTVRTVFYANSHGERIGYAIVAGTPAPNVHGGVVSWHDGTPYHLLDEHGAQVVTWTRNGHLCVVAGRGVAGRTLLRLASWDDHDTIPS